MASALATSSRGVELGDVVAEAAALNRRRRFATAAAMFLGNVGAVGVCCIASTSVKSSSTRRFWGAKLLLLKPSMICTTMSKSRRLDDSSTLDRTAAVRSLADGAFDVEKKVRSFTKTRLCSAGSAAAAMTRCYLEKGGTGGRGGRISLNSNS